VMPAREPIVVPSVASDGDGDVVAAPDGEE